MSSLGALKAMIIIFSLGALKAMIIIFFLVH